MRFLKIFLLIATVIINVHITTDIFAYATQDYCTAILANKCNNLTGCLWWSGHEGADMCQPCPEGYYCTVGTGHHIKCDQGYYCPAGTSVQAACPAGSYCPDPETLNNCTSGYYCPERTTALNTNNKCPSTHPVSPEKATAKSQCYYSIPAGYEYQAGSSVKCHSGGFCPGAQMKYGTTTDGWGWTPCSDSDIISGANGRTVNSSLGSDELTDCYVVCPQVDITNGYKQQYNQYAEATSGGKGTFPACNYQTIICNAGYKVNNNVCIAKTYNIKLCVDGKCETKTVTYDADMPTITPPTKTGHTFSGFFDSTDNKYYNADGTSAQKWDYDGMKQLTAKWQANTYTIHYILDGGAFGASNPLTATYDDEFTVSNPTKKNYTFASWSIEGMSDDTHYINGTKYEGTTATTAATEFENLHSTNNASVLFRAIWTEKYYEVTLNDTCPDGAAHPTTCKIGSQTVACSATPNKIYEKYNTGWYLTTQGGATFSQLIVLPVCNKYKFTGFCKGTCSDTNNRVINASGAKTEYMTNTMFSDDDTGTRQLTAHYAQCTCLLGTGAQSCSNTGTTEQNKCEFSIGCKTGYSKDGTQNGSKNFAGPVDVHQFEATCQPITYSFRIELDGGSGGKLPSGNINVTYDDVLPNLTSYEVPCKNGYIITGLKDSAGNLYYEYKNNKLTAVKDKWDKTESTTILTVAWEACSGGKYCECTNKPNEKQNCPALFTSDAPADAKTDCYMTGKINLSDKFGSTELNLDSLRLYLQQ